jgi:hypothetical protein
MTFSTLDLGNFGGIMEEGRGLASDRVRRTKAI